MGTRAGKVDAASLIDVALPNATKTYTVISHEFLIDTTRAELEKRGFDVKKEVYKANANGEVATAQYRIEYGSDPDLGMLFTWANSYDKSMKFKCAVGGFVRASGASVISDTINNYNRKHTGNADEETNKTIQEQIAAAEAYFSQLCRDKDQMKAKTLTQRELAEIVGILYFELGIISGEQAGVIKKEYKKPRFQYTTASDSLWSCYNHILVSLAKSNPKNWMDQQRMVHMFIMDHVGLQQFDSEETEVAEVVLDLETDPKDLIVYPPLANLDGSEPITPSEEPIDQLEEMVKATNTFSPVEMKEEEEPGHDYHEQVEKEVAEVVPPDEFKSVTPERVDPKSQEELAAMLTDGTVKTEKLTVDEIIEKYGDNMTEEEVAKLRAASSEELVSTDPELATVNMSKVDVRQFEPNADIGTLITIDEESYKIIDMTAVEYILKKTSVIEAEGTVVTVNNDTPTMSKVDVEYAFPGQGAGDIIEIEGDFFELTVIDHDDKNFALITLEVEIEEEVVEVEEETPEPVLPKQATAEDVKEEPPASSEEEVPAELNVDAVEEDGLKAATMMSHDEIEIIPPAEDKADDPDPIRQKIQEELLDIYGSIKEFTFEKKDKQYNVTLNTGEVVVLMEALVEVE